MIRVCMYDHQVYGEKEPYEDRSETHGICPECFSEWLNGSTYDHKTGLWRKKEAE